MTLWNIIRDFFVLYVFGGHPSSGPIQDNMVGEVVLAGEDGLVMNTTTEFFELPMLGFESNEGVGVQYICMGDWLSTTATIITLCLLLFAVFLAIKFLFKLVAGSFLKIGE